MHTVKGSFKDGVAKPDEPVEGHEGQAVLITFLDNSERVDKLEIPDDFPTPEEVVARIAARGPSDNYIPPTESLAQVLANVLSETPIDSAEWDRQWAEIEAEMDRIQREDDEAEGLI
jgi:hypothetical protein